MRFVSKLAVAAAILTMPVVASAAGYGAAGCGLGSIVFGDEPGFVQVFAATTNGTMGSQTFGITTGTSNCEGAMSASADQQAFVEINFASLSRDAAAGQGEFLSAYATILGCDATTHENFAKITQENHGQIWGTDANATDVLVNTKATLAQDTNLASTCTRI